MDSSPPRRCWGSRHQHPYLDNLRDMADELFDGNIASYMSLERAIVGASESPQIRSVRLCVSAGL
jgi:hypothetical protein